jgi:hypothetical protein
MDNIWLAISQDGANGKLAIVSGNDPADQAEPLAERQIINLIVAAGIAADFVSMPLQQSAFLSDNNIFPARLLISVVDDENVHAGSFRCGAGKVRTEESNGSTQSRGA